MTATHGSEDRVRLDFRGAVGLGALHEDVTIVPGTAAGVLPAKRPWPLILVICDAVSLIASFTLGALVRLPLGSREGPTSLASSLLNEVPYAPLFILAMVGYGLYYRQRRRLYATSFPDLGELVHAIVLGSILALATSALVHRLTGVQRLGWVEVLFMGLPALVLVPSVRGLTSLSLRSRKLVRSRLVVVGSGTVANSLARRLQSCPDIEVVGFVDDDPIVLPPCPHLGGITDLPAVCDQVGADRVLVAFSSTSPTRLIEVLRQLPAKVSISVVPRLFELVTWRSQVEELHGLTVMDVAPSRHGLVSLATKRAVDIVISFSLLLVLSPLMALIAVAIKLTSPGPVFFRQPRVGYKNRVFSIFKFRTMGVGSDEIKIDLREHNDVDGPLFKLRVDPRVTPVGRFLRSTSLDEIPQLINVLVGRMALVGPRPFVSDESAEINGWAARRFDVRPGMTGLWQISGRNDLPFEELRQLDYAYVASWSLWWDLKILWLTPGSVLRRHGAY
jgi:exopolysaccharide biosynthesis polyprenyl glycosylphosphotransferase